MRQPFSFALPLCLLLFSLSLSTSSDVQTAIQYTHTFYISEDFLEKKDASDNEISSRDIYVVTSDMWTQLQSDLNTFFLISQGAFVFLLQTSFPLLEGGMVRSKNVLNLVVMNVLSLLVCAAGWYLIGFAFAYGDVGNSFIGERYFGLQDVNDPGEFGTYAIWYYGFTFCCTATTIATGGMAERTQILGYMIYTFITASVTYPIVVHWMWTPDGWLGAYNPNPELGTNGALDFAGGLVVHVVGGVGCLVGILCLGSRLGRFDNDGPKPQGHSFILVCEGAVSLWFAFYGFNCGSTGAITFPLSQVSALAAVNTTMSAAWGGMTSLLVSIIIDKRMDLGATCNGMIIGLVCITSGCAYIDTWASIILGIVAALGFQVLNRLFIFLKFDDPVDAIAVHVWGGVWAAFSVGLFADLDRILTVHPYHLREPYPDANDFGAFMGGSGVQLGVECVAIVVIFTWTATIAMIVWIPLKLIGWLRVPVQEERMGLDEAKHGGHAYPEHSLIMRTLATRLLAKDKANE